MSFPQSSPDRKHKYHPQQQVDYSIPQPVYAYPPPQQQQQQYYGGAPPSVNYNTQYVQPPTNAYGYAQPQQEQVGFGPLTNNYNMGGHTAGPGASAVHHQQYNYIKPTPRPGQFYYDQEAGGGYVKPTTTTPGAYVTSAEDMIRKGFIRKVYAILSMQILATIAVSAFFMFNAQANHFVLTTPSLLFVGLGLSLVTLFALFCYREKYPLNMLLLGVWTLVEAYTVGVVCASYQSQGAGQIVLQAFIITAVIFVGLTLFTMQSKINFSFLGGFLGVAMLALLAWGIIVTIMGWQFSFVFSLIGAIVFSLYIVYDTYLLCKVYGPEDYIMASISLYLDIINLFLCLLRLLSNGNDRD